MFGPVEGEAGDGDDGKVCPGKPPGGSMGCGGFGGVTRCANELSAKSDRRTMSADPSLNRDIE